MEEVTKIIKEVGFPIFVALYFMYDKTKVQKQSMKIQEENNKVLGELKTLIQTFVTGCIPKN